MTSTIWGRVPRLEVTTTAFNHNTNLVHVVSGTWGHVPGIRVSDHDLSVNLNSYLPATACSPEFLETGLVP